MQKLLTTDGKYVWWPFSPPGTTTISLSSEEMESLRDPRAVHRILAHEHLTNAQVARLYECEKRGHRLKRTAKKIRQMDIADLCEGLGETKICNTLQGSRSDAEKRAELLAHRPWPFKVVRMVTEEDEDGELVVRLRKRALEKEGKQHEHESVGQAERSATRRGAGEVERGDRTGGGQGAQ